MKNEIMQMKVVLALCMGLLLATPLAAWAGGYTVFVPAPNGVDDTANLQRALDDCVRIGRDCTVQLAGGRYLTRQLVAYNFHGTFKGKGKNKTIIEALPELDVTQGSIECKPSTTDCLWPTLILFVDGDIHVSDMAIKVPAVPSTKPYFLGDWKLAVLIDALRVMGRSKTNASVERVAISGAHDDSDTSYAGYNLINGILFAGELAKSQTPFDFYYLSGIFSVTESSFNTMGSGAGADGFFKDSRVVIGGSPAAGNVFEDVAVGIDLESIENSVVEVSHNKAAGTWDSAWVIPWCCNLPTKPSLFLIHDNTFKPSGPYADGIYLQDDPANKWIYALIYDNKIEAQDIGYGGISAYNTRGTTVANNKVSGKGADAIGIWRGTYAAVLDNNVNAFVANPDAGLAQIVLDANTTQSTVVCKTPNDTVMDLGTGNKVMGCQAAASSAFSPKMASKLSTPSVQPRMKAKPTRR